MIKYRSYAYQWGRSEILILADPSESHEVEEPQFPPKMCFFYWNKGGKEARQNKIVHSIGTDFQIQYTKQLVNYCFELYTLKMWINLSTNKFRWYSFTTKIHFSFVLKEMYIWLMVLQPFSVAPECLLLFSSSFAYGLVSPLASTLHPLLDSFHQFCSFSFHLLQHEFPNDPFPNAQRLLSSSCK